MRSTLSLMLLAVALPVAASGQNPDGDRLDIVHSQQLAPYRAIRRSELYSAAFLTELRNLPYGHVLGPIVPSRVPARFSAETEILNSLVGIKPPNGASYQIGDTIVIAIVELGPKGWGDMILPTGLAKMVAGKSGLPEARVIIAYGPIREGQVTLSLASAPKVGTVQPVKAAGPSGTFLFGREARNLRQIGSELFIDLGRSAGIKVGDFISFQRPESTVTVAGVSGKAEYAEGQVVSLGEKSSTVRLFKLNDARIPTGTPVMRVATLPN